MIRLESAGASDVGQQRDANEDAFHLGDSIFAVADGMGGHRAGEIASAAAVAAVQQLDGKVFGEAEAAQEGLRQAFHAANAKVARMARDDSAYRGMGTTLTVAMGEGRRLHVAHIGDSRAYLLRDGRMRQITSDHTLVQHLLDEGQITRDQAASHPQRSIITRAIGVAEVLEVEALTLDLELGDTLLLCSDGLTGVISDAGLQQALEEEPTLQRAVDRLIVEANDGGGPDNITVVALRAVDDGVPGTPAMLIERATGDTDNLADAVGGNIHRISTDAPLSDEDWADRLRRYNSRGLAIHSDDDVATAMRRRRRIAATFTVALLLTVMLVGGRWLLGRSYYVGVDGGRVAIFQGVPASLGPIDFSWVTERSDVLVADLPEFRRANFENGIAAVSFQDAQRIVDSARTAEQPTDGG